MNKLMPTSRIRATHCANCGTTLQGPWCHVCGQSSKHMLRHLPDMIEDAAELLFHLNGRVVKTLPTLYFFPGRLTREYLAGHRARYVTPFRLMFVLCLLSFFFLHISVRLGSSHTAGNTAHSAFADAQTPAAVLKTLDDQQALMSPKAVATKTPLDLDSLNDMSRHALEVAALQRLQQVLPGHPPNPAQAARIEALARDSLASADSPDMLQRRLSTALAVADAVTTDEAARVQRHRQLHQEAGARLAALQAAQSAASSTDKASSGASGTGLHGWYAHRVARIKSNLSHLGGSDVDRERLVGHVFSALPQTMLVLVPVFALLLQLLYLFRRHLYMEHLMVSLHSHAFLFLSLLILIGLQALGGVLPHWADTPLKGLISAVWLWIPVYLLLMQKRIYNQGWGLTILKYSATGAIYVLLLMLTVSAATLIGLAG